MVKPTYAKKDQMNGLLDRDFRMMQQKRVFTCIDCIREGTPDIFLIERERGLTDQQWADKAKEVDKHREEAHGKQ